jgi:tetratricopeptide (TPR) repeat protein
MRAQLHACALAALVLTPLAAQAIELRTGEVLAAKLVAVEGERITVQVQAPKPERRVLTLTDLEPRAAWAILAARTPADDGRAHFALGEASDHLGLPTYAIAAFHEAARLEPALRADADAKVAQIRERVAGDLMQEAQDALAQGRWGEAKLTAQVVAQRFAGTKASAGAQDVVRAAVAKGRGATRAEPAPAPAVQKALAAAEKHEKQADAIELPASVGFTVKEQRLREQAVRHLEAAWAALAKIEPAADDAGSTAFGAARTRVQDKLGKHYVALARTLVQRRAVNQAEEWNAKACKLDPEGGGCQQTQDLIVQARLTTGYGY